MSSLLSPQIDFVFKNIFGVEGKEPLLISFLNSLFKGNPVVKNLTLGNTDICKTRHDGKSNRLDVRATIDDGTQLDIEIQCHNTEEIPQRALNYLANLMPEVINEGESYVVSKAIGIWILGENIIKKRKAAITECYMATLPHDPEPYYIDNMRLIFIELPKFCP
ncbi:MAG: Rpn family recombination-promoting nuclease/putative transposase, partial [Holosporales bacterium]|nr:Rpn family recombination-promoting nuclease/putative transposase [Holosporales bacterium]